MKTINELQTYTCQMNWTDETGAPLTPSAGTFRVDDITDPGNPVQVIDTTELNPTGPSHEIVVPHANNNILNQENKYEIRLITVTWTYSGSKQGTGYHKYRIENLIKLP